MAGGTSGTAASGNPPTPPGAGRGLANGYVPEGDHARSRAGAARPGSVDPDSHADPPLRAPRKVGEGLVAGLGAPLALTDRLMGALIDSDVPLDREHLRSAVKRLAALEAPLAGQVLF